MKRFLQSMLSIVLTIVIVFSLYVPSTAVATIYENVAESKELLSASDIPGLSVSTLVAEGEVSESGYQKMIWVDEKGEEVVINPHISNKPHSNQAPSLPSKYSSNELGYCSPVKNQGGTGSCWAFAAIASAESNLLRKSIIKSTDSLADLSEAHLVWFSQKSLTTDMSDPTFGDGTNIPSPYSVGGDWHRSTFTIARGSGFALENDYPFYPYNSSNMGNYDETKRYDSNATLNESFIIPDENTDAIKKAIMNYGSVSVAGLIVMEYFKGTAYYQDKYIGTNHQMIIVGWDDNYSVDNFRDECKPESPGAWLIKNSYDSSWGDNGYFWISYEEPSLDQFFVQDVVLTNKDETIYQYDGFGYHSMIGVPGYFDGSVANVFTAEKNEAVESVSFYTAQDSVTYEISVYKNVTKGANSPLKGGEKFAVVTEGYAEYQGYHKVKLDKVVPLSEGETFSIVVRMYVPESDGNPILIPVEGKSVTSDGNGNSIYCSSESGQSFFTLSDFEWSEPILEDDAGNRINYNNVCVKAFTVPDNALEIRTAEEFNSFATRVANGESFEGRNVNLKCDIDFRGGEIIPVGTEKNPFKGYFLGNGFVLKNGVINSDSDYVGVFSVLPENSEISKLGVEDITVDGVYGVGAVCGYNEGKIIYCYSSGAVFGEESVGGFVGINAGKISHSYSVCDVTGEYDAGSFVGEDDGGEVINSFVVSSSLDPIYNGYSDGLIPLDSRYFSNGLAAFHLDEGKTNLRKNIWTKRDGKTTFLKSNDEILYEIELFDTSDLSSVYVYASSKDSIKELAKEEKSGMTAEIFADSKHKVPYNDVPKGNAILYVVWSVDHDCVEYLKFVAGVEATCYTDGNIPYYECECGKLYTDENAENLVIEDDVMIYAYWHPLESLIKTERVEPTHTENGNIEYYTCPLCGDVFEEESCINEPDSVVIPALGHKYGDWITEIEPVCEIVGLKVRICSCGDRIEETISATGHKAGQSVEENRTEPDCVNEGFYDTVVYCSVCGEELSRETNTLLPFGHTEGQMVEENRVEPGCAEYGSFDTVVYCSACGEELSRIINLILPLGHIEGEIVIENNVEADCANNGSYDKVIYCTICGDELSRDTIMVDPLGHKAGQATNENIIPPDYETEGSYDEVVYCIVCDEEISRETKVISPLKEISISGTITSYLSETDEITIEFIKYGETEVINTLVVKGNNATYDIENILSGVYTVRIFKKNHVTREYENVIITEGEHNFKICPKGDVNGDGKITLTDYTQVLRHVKKSSEISDEYFLKCADVDENGRIKVTDYTKILRHVKKTDSLW